MRGDHVHLPRNCEVNGKYFSSLAKKVAGSQWVACPYLHGGRKERGLINSNRCYYSWMEHSTGCTSVFVFARWLCSCYCSEERL